MGKALKFSSLGVVLFLVAGLLFQVSSIVYASITANYSTPTPSSFQAYTFLSATTTSATSTNLTGGGGYFVISGAKKVTLYASRAWDSVGNSGSSQFYFDVSPDGTNWYPYNTLHQNVATSTTPTSLGSITISAATSTVITYMENLGFYAIRCGVLEATDGAHTCKATAEF